MAGAGAAATFEEISKHVDFVGRPPGSRGLLRFIQGEFDFEKHNFFFVGFWVILIVHGGAD